ncbi:hypothetical protein AMTRI_Chr02g257760 [Amborella trichopoda]
MLIQMMLATFVVSLDANWHVTLVALSFDHQPIAIRQPWSILTSDVLVRPCHVDRYSLTCQYIISVLSARLFPACWRSLGLAVFELELAVLLVSLDF